MRKTTMMAVMLIQVLLGEPAGPEADIWSCGVTIYFLLTGKMPFDVSTLCDLYQDVLQEDLRFPVAEFCQVSSQAMLLLTSMLSKVRSAPSTPERSDVWAPPYYI